MAWPSALDWRIQAARAPGVRAQIERLHRRRVNVTVVAWAARRSDLKIPPTRRCCCHSALTSPNPAVPTHRGHVACLRQNTADGSQTNLEPRYGPPTVNRLPLATAAARNPLGVGTSASRLHPPRLVGGGCSESCSTPGCSTPVPA